MKIIKKIKEFIEKQKKEKELTNILKIINFNYHRISKKFTDLSKSIEEEKDAKEKFNKFMEIFSDFAKREAHIFVNIKPYIKDKKKLKEINKNLNEINKINYLIEYFKDNYDEFLTKYKDIGKLLLKKLKLQKEIVYLIKEDLEK